MPAPEPNIEFETDDMQFAAFLLVREQRLAGVRRSGRKAHWVFSLPPEKLAMLEAQWPLSSEHRLFSVYQALKGQIRK